MTALKISRWKVLFSRQFLLFQNDFSKSIFLILLVANLCFVWRSRGCKRCSHRKLKCYKTSLQVVVQPLNYNFPPLEQHIRCTSSSGSGGGAGPPLTPHFWGPILYSEAQFMHFLGRSELVPSSLTKSWIRYWPHMTKLISIPSLILDFFEIQYLATRLALCNRWLDFVHTVNMFMCLQRLEYEWIWN